MSIQKEIILAFRLMMANLVRIPVRAGATAEVNVEVRDQYPSAVSLQ
jgi:hypothetical protein